MEIETCQPLIGDPHKLLRKVARCWDKISLGWRQIWGEHIHHGFYEHDSSATQIAPSVAQEILLQKICALLQLQQAAKILDVGCGMGGSSLYLAEKYQAKVVGISLSTQQIAIATQQAITRNLGDVEFKIDDAHNLSSCADESFDIVWSLESCEQFYNKKLFIAQAFRVLKPGGKLLLATWCADSESYTGKQARIYQTLCKVFDLPYMPTIAYYETALAEYFSVAQSQDWSQYVKNSWDYGIALLQKHSLWRLFKLGGWYGLKFASNLRLMSNAFKSGQIRYAVFVGVKTPSKN